MDKTWRVFKDSNVEWGQNTKLVREYVRANGIRECWFVAYGPGAISRDLQPCTLLPSFGWTAGGALVDPVPPVIRGTVFASITALPPRGGPEYTPLVRNTPIDLLGGSVLVYRGEFPIPGLAAYAARVRHTQLAMRR